MRKAAELLNWLVLLLLFAVFISVLLKGEPLSYSYSIGTGIGLLLMSAPFLLSIRAIRRHQHTSRRSTIVLNYLTIGMMALLVIYGIVVAGGSLAFLPLALFMALPAILNIRVLGLQKSESAQSENPTDQGVFPPLLLAAADGNVEELSRHLSSGSAIDQRGPSGETALMLAARNNRIECVKVLLANGADPKIRTPKNSSAEDVARRFEHKEAAELLASAR